MMDAHTLGSLSIFTFRNQTYYHGSLTLNFSPRSGHISLNPLSKENPDAEKSFQVYLENVNGIYTVVFP